MTRASYERLNFNFIRDIAPVAGIDRETLIMMVNPSLPVRTVAEFIAYAKANPGKINMASGGIGTSSHMAGELFKATTGVDMTHVPYRSGAAPATTDLLGGHVQVFFGGASASAYIKTGSLRALAVTNATRWDGLPDIPTVGEFETSQWYGLCAPKNTPTEIIDKLNKEINAALADPRMEARLADVGGVPLRITPADFCRLIAADTEKWAKVIRAAGIKAE